MHGQPRNTLSSSVRLNTTGGLGENVARRKQAPGLARAAAEDMKRLLATADNTKPHKGRPYVKKTDEQRKQEMLRAIDSLGELFEAIPTEAQGKCREHLESVSRYIHSHAGVREYK